MRSDYAPGYPFGQYQSLPVYKKIRTFSLYVPMQDGVRLAVTVTMPDVPNGMKLPALLVQTRYWRAIDYRFPMNWLERYNRKISIPYMAKHGYVVIIADVRGTGSSFGTWTHPWSGESFEDARDLVEWIIAQPWSNGKVGGYGGSFQGTMAELLAALQHPAVRAVIPMYNPADLLRDFSHPGGILNDHSMRDMCDMTYDLDNNKMPKIMGAMRYFVRGVMPVDEDRDRSLLAQAVREHATTTNAYSFLKELTYRDTFSKLAGVTIQDSVAERFIEQLKTTPTAIFGWVSFMDIAAADAAIRRFLTLPTARRLMIVPCKHNGVHYADPYEQTGAATPEDLRLHFNEWLRFFDTYLKDECENPIPEEKAVIYYTFGENRWRQTSEWPSHGHCKERWYLNDNHALSLSRPESSIADSYRVDWGATTGFYNRWLIFSPMTVRYTNRKEQTQRLLVYRTPPLENDVCITGQPIVNLYLSANASDGALFVYLEEEDENGNVIYLTEGELRLLHHKLSSEPSPYRELVPYRTFLERDAAPMPPGEAVPVTLGLLATSTVVRRGHRLRLSIAGHDAETFSRIPAPEDLTYTIHSDASSSSWLDLPVVPKN
jgi:uncharacterized protein